MTYLELFHYVVQLEYLFLQNMNVLVQHNSLLYLFIH